MKDYVFFLGNVSFGPRRKSVHDLTCWPPPSYRQTKSNHTESQPDPSLNNVSPIPNANIDLIICNRGKKNTANQYLGRARLKFATCHKNQARHKLIIFKPETEKPDPTSKTTFLPDPNLIQPSVLGSCVGFWERACSLVVTEVLLAHHVLGSTLCGSEYFRI